MENMYKFYTKVNLQKINIVTFGDMSTTRLPYKQHYRFTQYVLIYCIIKENSMTEN